jgi:hypothetical protein
MCPTWLGIFWSEEGEVAEEAEELGVAADVDGLPAGCAGIMPSGSAYGVLGEEAEQSGVGGAAAGSHGVVEEGGPDGRRGAHGHRMSRFRDRVWQP